MLEFKLNMYFEEFKEMPLGSRDNFRKKFKKKYGNFQYLEELIVMIERYQFKKYGTTLERSDYTSIRTMEEAKKISQRSRNRERKRLGK